MKYIDIHCHLNFPEYKEDLEETIARAQKEEIGMILVGTNKETSKEVVELAEKHENMWAIIGQHPTDGDGGFDYDFYLNLAKNKKVVGIGECGLDYFRSPENEHKAQQNIFIKHIELANEVKKPLMLHIRNGKDKDAYGDALKILKERAKINGDVHFFAGKWEVAKEFLDLGFYISFTGVLTFARDYDEVVKKVPLDRILSETDAPYVAPKPYRGKRNEPLYVKEVASAIASIKGESEEKVLPQLVLNARKLFGI